MLKGEPFSRYDRNTLNGQFDKNPAILTHGTRRNEMIRFEWFGAYRNEGSLNSEEELMINCASAPC